MHTSPENLYQLGDDRLALALEVAAAGGHNILVSSTDADLAASAVRMLPEILPPAPADVLLGFIEKSGGDVSVGGRVYGVPVAEVGESDHLCDIVGRLNGGVSLEQGALGRADGGCLLLQGLDRFSPVAVNSVANAACDKRVTLVSSLCEASFSTDFLLACSSGPGLAGRRLADLARKLGIAIVVSADRQDVDRLEAGIAGGEMSRKVARAREFADENRVWDAAACAGDVVPFGYVLLTREAHDLLLSDGRASHMTFFDLMSIVRVARTVAYLSERRVVSAEDMAAALGLVAEFF